LDSKDIPKIVDGKEEWSQVRDRALRESKTFILIITPGFDLSQEVKNELALARQLGKNFIYFRHRDLGRKIVVDLNTEKVDLGKQEQVSFETKEELLRLAHGILLKNETTPTQSTIATVAPMQAGAQVIPAGRSRAPEKATVYCAMCSKPIEGQPITEVIEDEPCYFDSEECANTFRKFRSVYGQVFH
jgi:hypothetical protein